MTYHLKMVRVDTQSVVAPMVNLFLPWDETVVVGEYHKMDCNGLTVQAHSRVPTTSTITGVWSLPSMAGTWNSIDLKTEMDDFYPVLDLGDDVVSTAHGQVISSVFTFRPRKCFGFLAPVSMAETVQIAKLFRSRRMSLSWTRFAGSSKEKVLVAPVE